MQTFLKKSADKLLAIILAAVITMGVVPVIAGNADVEAAAIKEIKEVVIDGITLPKEGKRPTVEGITTNGAAAGYSVYQMYWITQNGTGEYTGTFNPGETYRLYVCLVPSDGSYTFPSDVKHDIKFKANGVEYISDDTYQAGTACLWGDASELCISVYYKVPYTGWQEIDGKWYFFDQDGIELKGWQQIGTAWYYFTGSGVMQTYWQQIGGVWYYFTGSGVMLTGWQKIGEAWYYFESSGAMVTGWKEINGVYYFFKSNGSMAANEYCGGYWLDASGACTYKYKASWRQNATGWRYGDDSGWYAKNGTWKIDGKEYNFNASGYCTNP